MRILAIGDIHGCFAALQTLEETVPFRSEDQIVTVGDYVDRGSNSREVLDWLIARESLGRLIPLCGNHELMMIAARESTVHYVEWLACGGVATLASYGRRGHGRMHDVPDEHWRFLDHCRPYYETAGHFFVHANAYPELPLDEQPDCMLFWEKFHDPPPHQSGKVMICGHTPQKSGLPRDIGHAVCIDTRAYAGGWLTCLDVGTGQYWQANEARESRSGFLEQRALPESRE